MKTTFKQFALILFLSVFGTVATYAQTKPVKEKKHVCTQACTSTMHVYAHGEKGHVCTDACKKAEMPMTKEHVCTEACHSKGAHVYAHGEKGHVCTEACKKAEMPKPNMRKSA